MFLVRTYGKKNILKKGEKQKCQKGKKKIGTVAVYTATVARNKINGVHTYLMEGTLAMNTLTITHTNKKR